MPKRNLKGDWELSEEEKKQRDVALKDRERWRKHETLPKKEPSKKKTA